MMNNLASQPEYQNKLIEFRRDLENYLRETLDPRINGESPWDGYNLDKPFGEVV